MSSLIRVCSNPAIACSSTKIVSRCAGQPASVYYSKSMAPTRPPVMGIDLDPQSRCAHYRSALDIVAIKMKCCGLYYACKDCHDALAGHTIKTWPRNEWDAPAVMCGACGT